MVQSLRGLAFITVLMLSGSPRRRPQGPNGLTAPAMPLRNALRSTSGRATCRSSWRGQRVPT